jgi:type VI protein secretion system component VasF
MEMVMLMDEVRGEAFLRKLPQDIRDSLSPAQSEAISRVAQGTIQRRHPIDFRITVPLLFGGRAYMVLLLGKEKRSDARRQLEKHLRPTDRLSQIVVFGLGLAAFTLAAFIALLFHNAVLAP